MSAEIIAHPSSPRVELIGWSGHWICGVEPRHGYENLTRLLSDRDEADAYAAALAERLGLRVFVQTTPNGLPPEPPSAA